ncbi:MAG: tetratricopeptide repeat protein [Phycisphaerae bacterium]|nr:tetratricopeptide repeat protein [Phycisphaerae bacterium]
MSRIFLSRRVSTCDLQRSASVIAMAFIAMTAAVGCEGISRRHDARVGDISPPPEDVDFRTASSESANFPDLVEEMVQKRSDYINHLIQMERAYLNVGDINRANWARRQRELTERIEVYPYLTEQTPMQQNVQVQVIPRDSIPEADALFEQGFKLYDKFVGVPFVGFAYLNKPEPRQAVDIFKRVIAEYPTSDKVDDAAYYIGNIYKEFLRHDDPDNELALRYLKWAWTLDPRTPHPARFDAAVIYDFRLHDRDKAIELYHEVLSLEEAGNNSNQRFSATRIAQLSDDDGSHLRPREPRVASGGSSGATNTAASPVAPKSPGEGSPPDTSREPGPGGGRMSGGGE